LGRGADSGGEGRATPSNSLIDTGSKGGFSRASEEKREKKHKKNPGQNQSSDLIGEALGGGGGRADKGGTVQKRPIGRNKIREV